MVRNSCTVLESATEAVLEDGPSPPHTRQSSFGQELACGRATSSSLWPKGRPPFNIPSFHYSSEEGV